MNTVVIENDRIEARWVTPLSPSCDHRIVDGAL